MMIRLWYRGHGVGALIVGLFLGDVSTAAVVPQSFSASVTGSGQAQFDEKLLRRAPTASSFVDTVVMPKANKSWHRDKAVADVSAPSSLAALDHMHTGGRQRKRKLYSVALASFGVVAFFIIISTIITRLRGRISSVDDPEAEIRRLESEKSELHKQLEELDAQMAERTKAITERVEAEEAERMEEEILTRTQAMHQALLEQEREELAKQNTVKNKMMKLYQNPEELEAKRQKAEELMNGAVAEVQASAEQLGKETAKQLEGEVLGILEGTLPPEEVDQFKADPKNNELPSISIFLAAAIAPMQLVSSRVSNWFQLLLFFSQLVAFAIALIVDIHTPCSLEVNIWTYVMLILLSVTCFFRFRIERAISAEMSDVKNDDGLLDLGEEEEPIDNPILRLMNTFQQGPRTFFQALKSYDAITQSKLSQILNTITILIVIWGAFGVWINMHFIVDQAANCKAGTLLTVMHVNSFSYLFLITWTLLALALWALSGLLTSNEKLAVAILEAASNFDEANVPGGFPITVVLIRALLLRSEEDMKEMERVTLKADINDLIEESTKVQEKVKELEEELGVKERKLDSLKDDDGKIDIEEFIEKYTSIITKALDAATPLVGLAAVSMEKARINKETIAATAAAAEKAAQDARRRAENAAGAAAGLASSGADTVLQAATTGAADVEAPLRGAGRQPDPVDEQASSSSAPFSN